MWNRVRQYIFFCAWIHGTRSRSVNSSDPRADEGSIIDKAGLYTRI